MEDPARVGGYQLGRALEAGFGFYPLECSLGSEGLLNLSFDLTEQGTQ